jgi:hypothetical protein
MPPVIPDRNVTPSTFQETPDFERPVFRGNPFPEDPSLTSSEGSSNQRRDVRQWYMIVQESSPLMDRGHRISGQFTPQQISQNMGANIPEAGGYSRAAPIIQWIGGKLRTFTFQARLFSSHRDDNTAAEKLAELEYLLEEHEGMGRPPLVSFFWGIAIPDGFPCFVESLGGVTYDEIRLDGSLRGVTLSLTLKRWSPWRFEQVVTTPGQQTPVHIAVHGETYEMIAEREYGDPMLGVLLRQMNPRSPMTKKAPRGVADLQPGEQVKIYPIREMRRHRIRPACHVLRQDNRIAADNRRYFFELRSTEVGTIPRR